LVDLKKISDTRFMVQGASAEKEYGFLKRVRSWVNEAKQARESWFEDEQLDFQFYWGHQWSTADMREIEESGRVPLTLNVCATPVDLVCGQERSNRNRIKYLPVDNQSDILKAELISEVARVIQERGDSDFSRSEAFRDMVIGGRGFNEVIVDTRKNPRGEIRIVYVQPEEMLLDPTAREYDLSDARYIIRTQRMTLESILEAFPDKAQELLELSKAFIVGEHDAPVYLNTDELDAPDNEWYEAIWKRAFDPEDNTYEMLEVWYKQVEQVQKYEAFNPETNSWEPIKDDKSLAILLAEMPDLQYQEKPRWDTVFYQCFMVGSLILLHRPSPHQYKGYPYVPYFGKKDRYTGRWLGIVKPMRDPQMERNKRRVQILHILNRAAKYGWIGARGSFVEKERWEGESSKPGVVLEYDTPPGGKPPEQIRPPDVPRTFIELEKLSQMDIREVSGLNIEMLGLSQKDTPGIVTSQRIRQGIVILQNLFDNLTRSTKIMGKILLEFIKQYYSDGRIMAINGQDGLKYQQLGPEMAIGDYDLIIEESPWSPNRRNETFMMLQQIIPIMTQMGIPIPPKVLDYLDLPPDLVQEWKGMLEMFMNNQAAGPPDKGIPSPPKMAQPNL